MGPMTTGRLRSGGGPLGSSQGLFGFTERILAENAPTMTSVIFDLPCPPPSLTYLVTLASSTMAENS